MRYLVDTDWAIEYMRRRQPIVERFDELLPQGIGMSVISLAELYDGVLGNSNRQRAERGLLAFLSYIEEIAPLDDTICRIFAAERIRLRAAGNIIANLDLLIGSTAIRRNLTLLTNNRRDFERMRGLDIISA